MQTVLNGLLFITHRTTKYSHLQSLEIALEGGCRNIQLRMKDIPVRVIQETAVKAKLLCDSLNANLYINDHVDICKNVNASGVHLGKSDISPSEARKILGNDYIIGGTANTFSDIEYLSGQGVDYIGLGPFRFTHTKKNLSPILELQGYNDIIKCCNKNNINIPVFAIGGIGIDDIPPLIKTGISGIALSSAILNAKDPIEETKKIIHLINQQTQ